MSQKHYQHALMADFISVNDDLLHQILLNKSYQFEQSTSESSRDSRPSSGYSSTSQCSLQQENVRKTFESLCQQTVSTIPTIDDAIEKIQNPHNVISSPNSSTKLSPSCNSIIKDSAHQQLKRAYSADSAEQKNQVSISSSLEISQYPALTPLSNSSVSADGKRWDNRIAVGSQSIFPSDCPSVLTKSTSFDFDDRLLSSSHYSCLKTSYSFNPSFHSTSSSFYTLVHLSNKDKELLETTYLAPEDNDHLINLGTKLASDLTSKTQLRKSKSSSCLKRPLRPLSDCCSFQR